MIDYSTYYRKFGIRRLEKLTEPVLLSVNTLFLPFNSAIQFVPDDEVSLGIGPENVLLQHYSRTVAVDHVQRLSSNNGNPRPVAYQPTMAIQKYHNLFRKSRRVKEIATALKVDKDLIVINHALLPHMYKYMESPWAAYNKWFNEYATVWSQVEALANISDRQQFIVMKLPTQLPPISLLQRAEEEVTQTLLDDFTDTRALELLEFWRFLGDHRDKSVLNKVSAKNYHKVNLIWLEAGRWCLLNLGVLDSWREGTESTENKGQKLEHFTIQKRFLRFQMAIAEAVSIAGNNQEVELPTATDGEKEHIEDTIQPPTNVKTYDGETETIDEVPGMTETKSDIQRFVVAADKRQSKPTIKPVENKPKMKTSHDADPLTVPDVDNTDDTAVVIDAKKADEIDKDLEQLEKIDRTKTASVQYKPYEPRQDAPEAGVVEAANRIAKTGLITAAEHRRFIKLSERFKEIPNPYTKEGVLADLLTIKPEEIAIAEKNPLADSIAGVMDESMLSSSLQNFDKAYVKTVLPKDISSMVMNIQKGGIAVQNYDIQKVVDLNDEFEIHSIKLVPVVGSPTTIRFQLPIIDRNGVFKAAGTKYRLRKQRGDVPIRKVAPDEVALTSYYSKLFVNRSERAVFNYTNWLLNQLTAKGVDEADESVTDIRMANVFDHEADVPRAYSTIARRFSGFVAQRYEFFFDYNKREAFFGEKVVKEVEGKKVKLIPIAKNGDMLLMMDWQDQIHAINMRKPQEGLTALGTIEKVVGVESSSRPIEIAEVGVFGKAVPIGLVLGHEVGLGNLIATLGTEVKRYGRRERYTMSDNEFAVVFNDEALVFQRSDKLATMIFGSFNRFHRDIKKYSVYQFDKKEVYQIILENNGMGARYPREFDLMFKMWVDHITKGILEEMKEPTNLVSLLIRACELLVTDQHPSQIDNAWMRDKGYERIPGMMYGELVKAMRVYASRPANAMATVDLNPTAVWNAIRTDPTISVISECNPIHNLKEKEIIVYRGSGGRSTRSMTAESRKFHRNSMGVVSEATSDNADVGAVIYTTADPNYTSLRGTIRPLDKIDGNAAKIVSTSFLLAPGVENDDAKRINFVSIQNSQSIHCEKYTPMPTRTGYERVLAHRTDDLYAHVAEEDGVVEKLSDDVITIKYKSGESVSFEVGRRFGKMGGEMVPHNVATQLKEGDKFKKGSFVAFNTDYFVQDKLDPTQLLYKPGVLARTALMETVDTLEDSCVISTEFSQKMVMNSTHVRVVKASFEQEIRNLLEVGNTVEVDSILCTIQNASAGNKDLFDETSLQTLKAISSATPRAKSIGTIERIEVLYTGELDDMSESIRRLAERSDRELVRKYKQMGKPAATGQVDVGFRVDGIPMDMDTVAIRVYITGPNGMGVGDKGVFANQLKTVVARVMTGVNTTEDGTPIDAIFGYQSIANRIVLSPEMIGTLNSLLVEVGRRAVEAYKS